MTKKSSSYASSQREKQQKLDKSSGGKKLSIMQSFIKRNELEEEIKVSEGSGSCSESVDATTPKVNDRNREVEQANHAKKLKDTLSFQIVPSRTKTEKNLLPNLKELLSENPTQVQRKVTVNEMKAIQGFYDSKKF